MGAYSSSLYVFTVSKQVSLRRYLNRVDTSIIGVNDVLQKMMIQNNNKGIQYDLYLQYCLWPTHCD